MNPASRVLQFVSPSFDVFVAELCLALLSGACLVVPDAALAGADLVQVLATERITHAHLPASVLASLPRVALPELRTLITGAEPCPGDVLGFWSAGRLLVNAYGPTEATVDVTFAVCGPAAAAGPAAIGRPICDVSVYVLDAELRPVPPGVAGELYVSGPGLARGYLNEPRATAERFVANPFLASGARMNRTGDLGRWRPDGQLEFSGRADDQVKVRGFRIEPGEIESELRRQPGVAEAAVVVREDPPHGRRLIGYVVPDGGVDIEPQALRSGLAAVLPAYLIPAAFVQLDALPLTPNGKLDRRALPPPGPARGTSARPPRSPREQLLCELFGEVVGVQLGPDDNFFDAGGHSLLAARLVSRIRAVLGAELDPASLFSAPTPADLLGLIDSGDPGRDAREVLLPLRATGGRPPLFCVHPLGGNSWPYAGLLRALGPEYPVYGLQARGLAGRGELPRSLEEMVAHYAEQIAAVQPAGPYHLLGWSLGGNIVHALGTWLQREGAEVALLALLDAYPFDPLRRGRVDEREILTDMYEEYAKVYGMPKDPAPILADTSSIRQAVARLLGRSKSELRHFDETQRAIVVDVMVNNVQLVARHDPESFGGDMLLVTATRSRLDWCKPDDWAPFVNGIVETRDVECLHAEMLTEPAATAVGALLSGRIRQPAARRPLEPGREGNPPLNTGDAWIPRCQPCS